MNIRTLMNNIGLTPQKEKVTRGIVKKKKK